jgi:hypothetical protein
LIRNVKQAEDRRTGIRLGRSRPIGILFTTYAQQSTGPNGEVIYSLTDAASPNTLPAPLPSDPGLLSDRAQPKDIAFDDQVNRMEWEVEREKEEHRIVSGLDTLDFYALLRSFDKVSLS